MTQGSTGMAFWMEMTGGMAFLMQKDMADMDEMVGIYGG